MKIKKLKRRKQRNKNLMKRSRRNEVKLERMNKKNQICHYHQSAFQYQIQRKLAFLMSPISLSIYSIHSRRKILVQMITSKRSRILRLKNRCKRLQLWRCNLRGCKKMLTIQELKDTNFSHLSRNILSIEGQ